MVCNRFYPMIGGAEAQCKILSEKLVELYGCSVDVITYRHEKTLPGIECINGVNIRRLSMPLFGLCFFYISLMLTLFLNRKKYDVLHCHSISVTSFFCVLMATLLKKPIVLKHTINGELERLINGVSFSSGFKVWLKKILVLFAVRKASLVITLSDEGEEELTNCNVTSFKKISNGVDVSIFEQEVLNKVAIASNDKSIVFGFLGRFCEQKGIDRLLTVFSNSDIYNIAESKKLILMGSTAHQLESGIDLCIQDSSAKLHDHLEVWAPQNPPYEFYKSISIYISASRYEGLPNTVLEALACRKTCILSNIKPHAELKVKNPKANIYLFDNDDDLRAIINSVNHVSCYSQERIISDEYTIAYVANEYLKLYRDIIHRTLVKS